MDVLDLAIRFTVLILLTAISTHFFSINLRLYGVFIFAVWLMVFRGVLLRALQISIGVFQYTSETRPYIDLLQSPDFNVFFDVFILLTVILLYMSLHKITIKKVKNNKKGDIWISKA